MMPIVVVKFFQAFNTILKRYLRGPATINNSKLETHINKALAGFTVVTLYKITETVIVSEVNRKEKNINTNSRLSIKDKCIHAIF